jgi:hypothetical protein
MKIPKQIKIGGKIVDIEIVEGEVHFTNGESGIAFLKQNLIKIDGSQTELEQWSTLLHEILEFIKSMFELDIKHQDICCLEVALYQVLKDNKLKF